MFWLKIIWAACHYILSVSLKRCKHEALKTLHLKSAIKCFKEMKIDIDINIDIDDQLLSRTLLSIAINMIIMSEECIFIKITNNNIS